jgi:hypothetical protein
LVIVYASKKEAEMADRESIVAAVRKLRVIADLGSQPKAIGMLSENVQAGRRVYAKPIFRYEWRARVSSKVDEAMLEALRRELRDLEVHDIHLERT